MQDLVSIIIPIYNMEKSLEKCVRSILKQDYKNIEVILVDDGSKDNCYAICEKLREEDFRVECIHTENQGSGPARNIGIAMSKGRYLYFADADDVVEPGAISVLVNAMCNGRYDLVVFGYRYVSQDGSRNFVKKYEPHEAEGSVIRKDYGDYFGMYSPFGIQGAPWNKFFDGETVRKYQIEYPPLRRHQDEGFISRYVTYCKRVRFIPEVLYTYHQNTVSMRFEKFPVDYIEVVAGLNDVYNDTIMKWNPEDHDTHEQVKKSIYYKMIEALEYSYSPKMGLNFFSRIRWVAEQCRVKQLADYPYKVVGLCRSPKVLLRLSILACIKMRAYPILVILLYIGNMGKRLKWGK